MAVVCPAASLTGNWLVATPNGDGTTRRTYLNLKQQDGRITGTVRATLHLYSIDRSTGGPENFTITAAMPLFGSERRVTYRGKLAEDKLQLVEVDAKGAGSEMTAHRVPEGEGALPARIEPPPLHPVRDNGLARTPPMGWNSWNKFANRIDDATVRGIADAMASNGMRDAGYVYVNIDDTWEGERDAHGKIQSNQKFPDMKALADYVHSRGLKLGIYSSPGPNTCEGCANLCRLGDRLSEVRLVRRVHDIQGFRNAGGVSKNGRRLAGIRPRHCLQPVPVRPRRRLEMGARGGRQSVAHRGRY
jgi:alpha-galactosidase